jgi:hypothetical protein
MRRLLEPLSSPLRAFSSSRECGPWFKELEIHCTRSAEVSLMPGGSAPNHNSINLWDARLRGGRICVQQRRKAHYGSEASVLPDWHSQRSRASLHTAVHGLCTGAHSEVADIYSRKRLKKSKLHGLNLRSNYTDRATTACRRSNCQLLRIEGATWSA